MPLITDTTIQAASPVRWVGGKRWLLPTVRALLGGREVSTYHEPFLGGASIFFGLAPPSKSYLSDTNRELIAALRTIRDHPEEVADQAQAFPNDAETYYALRGDRPTDRIARAARFLYLNHTSYNGIYRVNLSGIYNVPFGYRPSPQIPRRDQLALVAKRLKRASLYVRDFAECIDRVRPGDVVFLDPPYTVAHNNNGFIKYNQRLFSFDDQKRLRQLVDEIKRRDAFYILANAAHKSIAILFESDDLRLETRRQNSIGGANAQRGSAIEYLFTNLRQAGSNWP